MGPVYQGRKPVQEIKKGILEASVDLEKDFSQIFLCHAKMYVFADYYGISRLMDLSREKLGHLLIALATDMKFHGQRLANFVALVRYCYDKPSPEALQSFVMMYSAYHAKLLWKDAQFQELLKDDGEVAFAFIKEVMPAYLNAKDGVSSEESSSEESSSEESSSEESSPRQEIPKPRLPPIGRRLTFRGGLPPMR